MFLLLVLLNMRFLVRYNISIVVKEIVIWLIMLDIYVYYMWLVKFVCFVCVVIGYLFLML